MLLAPKPAVLRITIEFLKRAVVKRRAALTISEVIDGGREDVLAIRDWEQVAIPSTEIVQLYVCMKDRAANDRVAEHMIDWILVRLVERVK
jgi:hypothetical protein